jgi:hypothetical protein
MSSKADFINELLLLICTIALMVGFYVVVSDSYILPKGQFVCTQAGPGDDLEACDQYTRKAR